MRILVDESLWGAEHAFASCGTVQTFSGRSLRREDVGDAEALVVRSVTRVGGELLAGSKIRFVGTATTGTDHVDLDWLSENNIVFASAAGCNARPVAEYVITSILLLANRYGFDPADKTLGVVGVGRVGSRVVRWARDMGMRVLPHDPPLQCQTGSDEYVSLERLAGESDLVTLHVPLSRTGPFATADMVDAAWLSALRPGVFLLNTSRGEVVQESALLAALQDGHIAAAVLDVWRNEPNIDERLLREVALGTPHIAGYSLEAKMRATHMVRDALAAWMAGSSLEENPVPSGDASCGSGPLEPADTISLSPIPPDNPWWRGGLAALLHACDLTSMDTQLRQHCEVGSLSSGFDALRPVFAKRREFDAYCVEGCPPGSRASQFLRNMGFHLTK